MSVVQAEIIRYSSANVPTDDVSTSGGAIDLTSRPNLTQLSATSVIAAISDGADTRSLTITGRLSGGAIDTEVLVLTGAVEVVGAKSFARILKLDLDSTDAARTVTVKQGSGGTSVTTIGPDETTRHIWFQDSGSESSATDRYEKAFVKNTNATGDSLLGAEVTLTADPEAKIKIGLDPSKDDTLSAANRKTAPAGVAFVDDNIAISVPGTNLDAGEAIGVWAKMSLLADAVPVNSSFTTSVDGTTA